MGSHRSLIGNDASVGMGEILRRGISVRALSPSWSERSAARMVTLESNPTPREKRILSYRMDRRNGYDRQEEVKR